MKSKIRSSNRCMKELVRAVCQPHCYMLSSEEFRDILTYRLWWWYYEK